jgi:hypothetical protein
MVESWAAYADAVARLAACGGCLACCSLVALALAIMGSADWEKLRRKVVGDLMTIPVSVYLDAVTGCGKLVDVAMGVAVGVAQECLLRFLSYLSRGRD